MSGITDRYGSNIMDEPDDPDEVGGTASKEASFEEKEAAGTSELNKYLSVYDQTFDKIQIPPDVVEEMQACLRLAGSELTSFCCAVLASEGLRLGTTSRDLGTLCTLSF